MVGNGYGKFLLKAPDEKMAGGIAVDTQPHLRRPKLVFNIARILLLRPAPRVSRSPC